MFEQDLVTRDAEICLAQIRRISARIMRPERNVECAVTKPNTFINVSLNYHEKISLRLSGVFFFLIF